MDMQKTVREIGLFETAANLETVRGSADVIQKVGASMPLPGENIGARAKQAAEWLLGFGKSKYMFLTPEIALIEEMRKLTGGEAEMIIAIPCDLDQKAKERIYNNTPRGAAVTVLEEPYFPAAFYPGNGVIVICGYLGGGRAMVLQDTYRLIEHYSGFRGKRVFVPYQEFNAAVRYEGWMETSRERLNEK